VDEGEKERNKITVLVKNVTLLAQAEVSPLKIITHNSRVKFLFVLKVISDITSKNLKNNTEIVTKEDSLIFPVNVSSSIWTMNKEQVKN
jgi:hypothetical protein